MRWPSAPITSTTTGRTVSNALVLASPTECRHHIPLGALVPKGATNLLVPGRGASGDQMAMSSFRVMTTCAQMGLAAGLAAAQCVTKNCSLPGLDMAALRSRLADAGQSLALADYGEHPGIAGV